MLVVLFEALFSNRGGLELVVNNVQKIFPKHVKNDRMAIYIGRGSSNVSNPDFIIYANTYMPDSPVCRGSLNHLSKSIVCLSVDE